MCKWVSGSNPDNAASLVFHIAPELLGNAAIATTALGVMECLTPSCPLLRKLTLRVSY